MHPGWIGGMIGVAGGILGTCCGIKNTNGPRERAFMVKASAVCWACVFAYFLLLAVLPRPYGWFAAIPYAIFLCLGILCANRTPQGIRQEESESQPTEDPHP